MHEMQTIVTDECGVCPSVCHVAQLVFTVRGHSVQPLPNHFGLVMCFSLLFVFFDELFGFILWKVLSRNFVT